MISDGGDIIESRNFIIITRITSTHLQFVEDLCDAVTQSMPDYWTLSQAYLGKIADNGKCCFDFTTFIYSQF